MRYLEREYACAWASYRTAGMYDRAHSRVRPTADIIGSYTPSDIKLLLSAVTNNVTQERHVAGIVQLFPIN